MFRQAAVIMCLGMGLTFVFLYVVILAMRLTGWLVRRYEAGLEGGAAGGDAGALVAAIAVAIREKESGQQTKG